MAKQRTAYVCTECGHDSSKWAGQCPECNQWNTMQEFRVGAAKTASTRASSGYAGAHATLQKLSDVKIDETVRISSGMVEFDRVLGGGFVAGSVVLIGGSPGAGKSTLLLQTLCLLGESLPVLYVTGEESPSQVAMRANRLQLPTKNVDLVAETDVHTIIHTAQQQQPKVMVIDSIQVMYTADIQSAPGSVSQVRETAALLTRFAKQTGTILMLVGHVTKDGNLAGPKVLEHMIDCSMLLEGDSDGRFRTLRSSKNRFGSVNELGIFAMMETGLKEVKNPSAIFLTQHAATSSGTVVMVVWEGTRPLLVELQALVDTSHFGNPRRVAVGTDNNRLAMLLAVLHRHGGLQLGDQDVFVNIVGGVKVLETGADLALILAMVSSFKGSPLEKTLVVFGEVGLSGEIRPVPGGQERLREAAKHGFTKAIVPKGNVPKTPLTGMTVMAVESLEQALALV